MSRPASSSGDEESEAEVLSDSVQTPQEQSVQRKTTLREEPDNYVKDKGASLTFTFK